MSRSNNKQATQTKHVVKLPPLGRATKIPALHAKQPLPAKSLAKADKVFENFSLSKFPKRSTPPNYVVGDKHKTSPAAHRVPSAQEVQHCQRKLIEQHLKKLRKMDSPNRGMALSLSRSDMNAFFPSYNEKKRTLELSDVMKLISRNVRGTEFYAKGNPVLNRLALKAQVQQIMAGGNPRRKP